MAWTTPSDRVTSDIITAAQWNSFLGLTGDMSLTATGIVTTQGDTVYATAANTLARLAKGTAYQMLGMNAGATAPSWQASATSALTTTGDVLYASGANTLARLGIGSSSQVLTVTAGLPSWTTLSTPGSTVPTTTTGQILYASATNVLSALAVGTAYQMLAMNSGATLPTYQASPTSVLTTIGDILYASAANTLARLAASTSGYSLVDSGVAATATITGDTVIVNNADTVVINSKTYTFQTVLTNTDGNVKIAATAALSLTNLFNAINGFGGVIGTDYATATTPHPTVTATNPTATTVVLTAKTAGTGGNSLTLTENSTHLSVSGATLSGGVDSLPTWTAQVSSIGAILDGGGAAIPANTIIYVRVPFACIINEFTILADQSGSVTVKVYKDTYANYPPTSVDDISFGGLAVTSTTKATDTTLTSWGTIINAGDVLAFTNTTIATTITRVTCQLKVTRT